MAKIINIKNEVLIRVYIVGFMIALTALIIMGQAIKIQFVEGKKWRDMREKFTIEEKVVVAERGNIFATSLPFFDIRFDPTVASDELFFENVDSLAHCLARMNTEYTEGGWQDILIAKRNAGKKYLEILDKVSYSDMEYMKKFPIFNQGRYKGGFIAEERFRRYMPFRPLGNRTLGYVRRGKKGEKDKKVGLEGYFDSVLAGESGKRLMYKLSGKDSWMPVNDLTKIEPKKGLDVVSTIDVNIQDITYKALYSALKKSKAEYGVAIVMEVKTGAIKAITNLEKYKDKEEWGEIYNHAIANRYEPGSTYKLASIMALLEDGYIELDDIVELDSGEYQFYEELMVDSGKESFTTDSTSIRHAFEISSNVGIAKLVDQHYNHNENCERSL